MEESIQFNLDVLYTYEHTLEQLHFLISDSYHLKHYVYITLEGRPSFQI